MESKQKTKIWLDLERWTPSEQQNWHDSLLEESNSTQPNNSTLLRKGNYSKLLIYLVLLAK